VGLVLAALVMLAGCSSAEPAAGCPPSAEPALLVCQLGDAWRAIDDPAADAQRLAEAGQLSQAAIRRLGDHPEWDAAALAALAPARREQTRLAVDAYRQLLALAGPPSATLPAWQVVAPQPAAALRSIYEQAQQRFGVDWTVLAAINLVETRMGRVVGLSSAGAQGPMQFMPATWAQYGLGGDVWETRDAIMGAAHYLAANGAAKPERLDHAIERYNHDLRYVRAVRDYAAMMAADPRAFLGLHAWPVEYRTVAGPIRLPIGYRATQPIPVTQWLAGHPVTPLGVEPPAAPPP
jgi:membrane-bound lytic murein transglycosylase B